MLMFVNCNKGFFFLFFFLFLSESSLCSKTKTDF